MTRIARAQVQQGPYHVNASAVRHEPPEHSNTVADDDAADAVPVVMLDEFFNVSQSHNHADSSSGSGIAPDASTAAVKKVVVKSSNRRGGRR